MKIFAWMHRKLHTNVDYSMISREKERFSEGWKKSASPLTCQKDTEALLRARDHVTILDALGGWHDGILAIGTFGLDRIHPLDKYSVNEEEEYSIEEDDEEEDDDDEGKEEEEEEEEEVQMSSLAVGVAAFKREVDWDVGREMVKSQPLVSVEMEDPARPFLKGGDWEEEKKKGERTTLADLFNADAAAFGVGEKYKYYCKGTEMLGDTGKKTGCSSTKQVRSLAKKLLPWKGDDSRPTAKLHRLMRKMLKRKIHPELERKIHGVIGADDASEIKPTLDHPGLKNNLDTKAHGNELVSLLQGRDHLNEESC